jgi:hypothetical protein
VLSTLVFLAVSALVFLGVVVQQRDARGRDLALQQLEPARKWLAEYLDDRGYLPPEVPDDSGLLPERPTLAYPAKEEITRLRRHDGPYALIIGRSLGLITPGMDGCAAIIYDHGKVRIEWLDLATIRAERQKRVDILNGI